MKRIVNRRFIYYLKKKTIILTMILSTILGLDTEQTHNLPLSIDLSEVPLDGAWTPVCFDSARIFFMLKRKRAKAIRTLASTRPSAKHATAGERRFRGVRLYTMWSTGFRTKVAQQKSHSHIDMMSKNHRTWFAIHCSYSNDWRSMWDWGNTADD